MQDDEVSIQRIQIVLIAKKVNWINLAAKIVNWIIIVEITTTPSKVPAYTGYGEIQM